MGRLTNTSQAAFLVSHNYLFLQPVLRIVFLLVPCFAFRVPSNNIQASTKINPENHNNINSHYTITVSRVVVSWCQRLTYQMRKHDPNVMRVFLIAIERESTALYTCCQEVQGSWHSAPRLGAKLCHRREIPSTKRTIV